MNNSRERLYETLLRISPDAICLFSKEGNILMTNDKASELLKLPIEKILGINAYDMVGPDEKNDIRDVRKVVDKTGFLLNKRFNVIRLDGTIIPVEVSYSSVPGDNGTINGYLAIFRDISDKIKAEEENERLEKQLLSIIIKRLSDREIEMIRFIHDGYTWPEKKREIAGIMNVMPGTLDKFMSRIKTKLETDDISMILQIVKRGFGWK